MTIYQVLPRLYGNRHTTGIQGGTIRQNGCGKMLDFSLKALRALRGQGYTHIWYTGLLEHATQTVYPDIAPDNPDIVKGKAGSPYAVKDYYDIDPDLARRVADRRAEFCELLARSHKAGLKVIMDFVPNHVARHYVSDAAPQGVRPLGADDDTALHFSPDNNFYYCPDETLRIGSYTESPARASGNDVFHAHPTPDDWYETCKLNYGGMSPQSSTWQKMTDILLYWAEQGVDGFRCDMAEMVPVSFWHHAIAAVLSRHPHVRFIAEVYNPQLYRDYIRHGGFHYLYDKAGFYDTLRAVVAGGQSTQSIPSVWQSTDDIRPHMLYFLENHDEQRLASPFFASAPQAGRPAMAVAALMGTGPLMVYSGQEIGERGMTAEGYSGQDGRTSIFDYWAYPFCRKLAGREALTPEEEALREWYTSLLQLRRKLRGTPFYDLMYANPALTRQYAFLRGEGRETRLIVANFHGEEVRLTVRLPRHAVSFLHLPCAASHYTIAVPAHDYAVLTLKNPLRYPPPPAPPL